MAQIEKVVSLFDEATATRANSAYVAPSYSMPWLYTAGNYEPAPEVYFEAVLSTSLSGSAAFAELHNGTSQIVEVSTNSTSASLVRSANIAGSLSDGGTYRVRIKSLGAAATTTLFASRIIIIQNGTISKTETIYTFGTSFITASTSYTDDTAKTYYYWDSSQFDGNVALYFEGFINNQTAGASTSAILINNSGSVNDSMISITGTTETRVRSGSFTLVDGLANIRLRASSSNARARQARMIITQTGSPTKTESYYPIGKTFVTITSGSYRKPIIWKDSNWSVGSKEIFYQAWLNRVVGTSLATLYSYFGNGNIVSVSEASSPTITREISGSLVLPDDSYDTFYSGTNGTGFGTDIIIRAVLTSASGGSSLVSGSSLLSGNADGGFAAYLLSSGFGEFSANGEMIPFGILNIPAQAELFANGVLFGTAISIIQSAINILGDGHLISLPIITIPANASLDGAGYLIATAFIQALVDGQVILSGQGDLILSALNLINSSTSLSGESLLLLQSLVLIYVNGILSGNSNTEINSNLLINSVSNMVGRGDLLGNGILIIPSNAILTGLGYLIATSFIQGLVNGDVSMYGNADILSNAFSLIFGGNTLSGNGDINSNPFLTISNSISLEGLAFLIASGFVVGPVVTVTGEAVLYGQSDLISTALRIVLGQSINSGESILSTQALVNVLASAIVSGVGNIEANSILLMTAVAALVGSGAIVAIGTIPSEILATITPLSRTLVIPSEDRVYIIDSEGRVYVIKADRRNYDIED